MRKLATIRKISEISPIPGADAIEVATIEGWKVVIKKGEFQPGSYCVYFEVDSFLPTGNAAWQHLVDKSSRTFEGVVGHRIRTIKLRGQVSQGFVAPIHVFPQIVNFALSKALDGYFCEDDYADLRETDFAEMLGVKKYEKPLPAELVGQAKGSFPGFIQKTDQERCQNMVLEIFEHNKNARYEVTIKLDGTSFTGYHNNGDVGVCSRNLELKVNDDNASNSYVRMFIDSGLKDGLAKIGKNIAVQGELMGPGVQKNREGLKELKLFVFDIQDIDTMTYLSPSDRLNVLTELYKHGMNDMVTIVPVEAVNVTLAELGITDMDKLLAYADGPSLNHPVREGVVFKRMDGEFSFKVISNKFLLKEDD